MPFEVLTMGRVGVDVYPLQTGVGLAEVSSFGKYLGGSPTNVAVAAARYGRTAAVITKTGRDPFGDFVREALDGYGVDSRFVGTSDIAPTPVTFCEIFPPDDFPLYFYRLPKAPDLDIAPGELDLAAVREASVFWITGTGLSEEPSRSATLAALEHRAKTGTTVFDLDWRPAFWNDTAWRDSAGARTHYAQALRHTTVAVGNLDECEVATGEREPYAAAKALLAAGVELAVVKQGPKGVLAMDRDGATAEIPPVPVDVVNGLGAGDAFGGALCHGLLSGWNTRRTVSFEWQDGKIRNDLSTEAVIKSISIASGLGRRTAYTWLKLPVVDGMERVLASSTLPALLLGGEVKDADAAFASWGKALRQPTAQGLVVGRSLLYPASGDVAGAVDKAVSLL